MAAGEHELPSGAQHALPVDAVDASRNAGPRRRSASGRNGGSTWSIVTGSRQMPSAVVNGRSSAPLRSTTASDIGMRRRVGRRRQRRFDRSDGAAGPS